MLLKKTKNKQCSLPLKPSSSTYPYSCKGVTLVELLVVIAVMLLLLSILVPALGRAKDQANLALCKNRLRNICVAANMYADEHNGCFPLIKMVGPGYDDITNSHTPLVQALIGGQYLGKEENFYCPSEDREEFIYSEDNLAAGVIGYFYYACEQPTENRDIPPFLRWEVKWPRRLRNFWDSDTWVVSDCWFRGRPTPHYWYKKGVNYATIDNSVRMVYRSPRRDFR